MLLLGAYFLLSAIVIPNIAASLTKKFSPITVSSPTNILLAIVVIVALVGVGVFLNRKEKSILD